jgi:aspartate beta-hydroxylase
MTAPATPPSAGGAMPAAVRLLPVFDPGQLQADLAAVSAHHWSRQRISNHDGVGRESDLDWRVLPLRSVGGDGTRTDPGGPGPADYAPTPWLEKTPYLAGVLGTIPGPLNAARLMALGPGTVSHIHSDPKYALTCGFVRLHVPIVTNPGAILVLDGVPHRWQPGELWCGQFARPHQVRNDGDQVRVHLVVDALISTGLAQQFPAAWRPELLASALFTRPCRGGAVPVAVALDLPAAFTDFSRDDVLGEPAEQITARVTAGGGQGRLVCGDGREFALVHLGRGEFRFAGWSQQRTLQLHQDQAVLRIRDGRGVRELSIPHRKDDR